MTAQAPGAAHIRPGEAAKRIGVEPSTLRKWVAEGLVEPTMRTAGNESRFSEEDLAQVIERYRDGGGVMVRSAPEPAAEASASPASAAPLSAAPMVPMPAIQSAQQPQNSDSGDTLLPFIGVVAVAFTVLFLAVYLPYRSVGDSPHAASVVAHAASIKADEVIMVEGAEPIFFRDGMKLDVARDRIIGSTPLFNSVETVHLAQVEVGETCKGQELGGERVQVCPVSEGKGARLTLGDAS